MPVTQLWRVERCDEIVVQRTNTVSRLQQDAVDLPDLFDLKLADAIPFLDRRGRFDEQGGTRPRRVMHDPTNGPPRFAADRDHIPPVPNGHRHVGHLLMRLELCHDALEQPNELRLRPTQLAAQPTQLRRCIVSHGAVVRQDALQRRFFVFRGDESGCDGREDRCRHSGPSRVT